MAECDELAFFVADGAPFQVGIDVLAEDVVGGFGYCSVHGAEVCLLFAEGGGGVEGGVNLEKGVMAGGGGEKGKGGGRSHEKEQKNKKKKRKFIFHNKGEKTQGVFGGGGGMGGWGGGFLDGNSCGFEKSGL